MVDKKLFMVIKNNIECAFCKQPNCPLRYQPEHFIKINGLKHICKKEYEKRINNACGMK